MHTLAGAQFWVAARLVGWPTGGVPRRFSIKAEVFHDELDIRCSRIALRRVCAGNMFLCPAGGGAGAARSVAPRKSRPPDEAADWRPYTPTTPGCSRHRALVLFMTAPGLAMFYGGLVRKKNVLGVMMQCVFLMGLMTVIWALYGYTLAFGGSDERDKLQPYIGNGDYLFMNRTCSASWDRSRRRRSLTTPMDAQSFRGSRTCCSRACSSSSRRR